MNQRDPTYKIHAVAQITGVTPATLRAWERRYGIPSPSRSDSNYRLYSEHDVEIIRRFQALRAENVSPAEAARLVRATPVAPVASFEPSVVVSERIIDAMLRYDAKGVERAVRSALQLGSANEIYTQTILPTMRKIGEMWTHGQCSIAQEHLVSFCVEGLLKDLLRWVMPEDTRRRALMACFATEDHVIPLLGASLCFAQWSYEIVFLGARTPPESIRETVMVCEPEVIGLSITVVGDRERSRRLLDDYADACGEIPWIVGGAGADALAEDIEARGGIVAGPYVRSTLSTLSRSRRIHGHSHLD